MKLWVIRWIVRDGREKGGWFWDDGGGGGGLRRWRMLEVKARRRGCGGRGEGREVGERER